ncbi:MAG: hypothetical protein HYT28_00690 [Parcubacteria group bacterium]|nr:hypothetical protein [Parcubacteria group bacterium]
MLKYVSESQFEEFAQKISEKHNVSLKDAEETTREALNKQGISVGIPKVEEIKQAQVRAGEEIVIKRLRKHGLV